MKISRAFFAIGCVLACLWICSCTTDHPVQRALPAELSINPDAGRGGLLVVMIQLESGEKLPFVVDTGASGSLIDKSLVPQLGQPLGTAISQSWGTFTTNQVYAAPKMFLGGAPLQMTGPAIIAYDCQRELSFGKVPIMGLLGMDVLEHYCIQLDFAAGKMRFLDTKLDCKIDFDKRLPIVPLNDNDARPAIAENLLGLRGPHSLIDVGCNSDGWLMTNYFQQWTNHAVPPETGEAREPGGYFAGEKYPLVSLQCNNVESDGLGLRFLARHLVTLDFPNHTLYLARQSVGPLPALNAKTTTPPALATLIADSLLSDTKAMQKDLLALEHSRATEWEKTVARKLTAAFANEPKPAPDAVPRSSTQLFLGDAQPASAQVGWLHPAANYIPPNAEVISPLLDSGKIYATGLFAHSPSRYVFNLGGQWARLRGEAGLHTDFQGHAYGVKFVIQADGREIFRSATVSGSNHVRYDVDVQGAQTLELVVEPAGDRNGGNWALWLDPVLSKAKSRSENWEGCCFRGLGWQARRDEGEYPWWVFD